MRILNQIQKSNFLFNKNDLLNAWEIQPVIDFFKKKDYYSKQYIKAKTS